MRLLKVVLSLEIGTIVYLWEKYIYESVGYVHYDSILDEFAMIFFDGA